MHRSNSCLDRKLRNLGRSGLRGNIRAAPGIGIEREGSAGAGTDARHREQVVANHRAPESGRSFAAPVRAGNATPGPAVRFRRSRGAVRPRGEHGRSVEHAVPADQRYWRNGQRRHSPYPEDRRARCPNLSERAQSGYCLPSTSRGPTVLLGQKAVERRLRNEHLPPFRHSRDECRNGAETLSVDRPQRSSKAQKAYFQPTTL